MPFDVLPSYPAPTLSGVKDRKSLEQLAENATAQLTRLLTFLEEPGLLYLSKKILPLNCIHSFIRRNAAKLRSF
jgi:hypothetical protein